MRINVYSQELTSEVNMVEKGSNTGVTYHAAQLMATVYRRMTGAEIDLCERIAEMGEDEELTKTDRAMLSLLETQFWKEINPL